ncbi:response regulator containing a -like receiver domain protein and a ggdef domain protein [Leptolyngbya sp. Heron Island J]|uniref:response regulator n=1 Tax=Leptolyngbya sp. Heron Island J TaxID=1385935 RepID=UPI0003B98D0D|nr:response regulator [Leptolyngbya sp. Heron Island J]ESA33189.1 response regulator containing a -like receiver domain protein and a ggdef domain protein [Leptolyngbya sp. Heron Island J]
MPHKILLVAEDSSVCSSLQPWLTQCGYTVVLATEGGDQGILLAVTESPDLILIDTDLPVISGWQTINILKASTVTRHIPVMALVLPTTAPDWNRVLDSGCDACELKPIDIVSILTKVKTLLNHPSSATASYGQGPSVGANLLLFPKPPAIDQISVSTDHQALGNRGASLVKVQESTVVYIDDSAIDSQTMAAVIQQAGYDYHNISNPIEAIPLLLEIKPKLIFLDLVMPYTNGYEVCTQIRRASNLKNIPVVIVTNNSGIIDRVRATIVGASGFLSKPIKEKRVLRILQKHLAIDSPSPASFQSRKVELV